MVQEVQEAIEQIRPKMLARNSDIKFVRATELGIVTVDLSGECCSGRLSRLLTILDIEKDLKAQIPKIKVVMENC